jgi:hypothetical protein
MVKAPPVALAILMLVQASLLVMPFEMGAARINPGANIIIEGNGGFSNPYVTGVGTSSNPYLMQDLDMNAYNIQIKNTTSYVLIRNVTFTQSTRHALYLYNADNLILDNISCTDRSKFVHFSSGSNLVIRGAKVTNVRSNLNLIDVVSSNFVTVSGSTFLNRTGERGSWISFDSAAMTSAVEDCTMWGVGIKDNGFTANNRIERCRMTDQGISLDNTAPGARIQNCTIDYPLGNAIAISKSNRIDIKGNSLLNANNGIYFTASPISSDADFGRIDNNTFEACTIGIGAFNQWPNQPSRYLVTDNYFGNCTNWAISWQMGTSNRMWDNVFFHNVGTGDTGSTSQATEGWQWGGNANEWTYGGRGNFWQNHRMPDADGNGIVDLNYTITSTALDTAPYSNRYLDRDKPTITLLSPSGKYANSYYTILSYTASDVGSGVKRVQRSQDGYHWTDLKDPSYTSVYLKKGMNDIHLRVFDIAGLPQTLKRTLELNSSIDPLRLEVPTEGSFVRTDPLEISWVAAPHLPVMNQSLTLDGDEHYIDPGESDFVIDLSQGQHYMHLSVKDPYGMYLNRTSNFTVDLTRPTLGIASPQDGSVLSNPIVGFRIVSSDNLALKALDVVIDGLAWDTFDPGITNMRLMGPGIHTLSATVIDSAGWANSSSIAFTVTEEGIGTGLSFIDPAPDGTYTSKTSHDVKWDYTGSFAWTMAYLRVGVSGSMVKIGSSRTWGISLPNEGAYELTLRLVDGYENYVETKGMLYRDSTSPKVYIPDFEDGARVPSGMIQLNWTTVDESPIVSYDYAVDGGGPTTTNSTSVDLDLSEGSHTVDVRAYDAAGNVGKVTKGFIIDLTPTTVHIGSPTEGSVIDGSGVAIRWDISDPDDVATLTMSIDEDTPIDIFDKISWMMTIVNEGSHTITIECADRAGNIWSDSVTFTVDRMDPEVGWNVTPPRYINSTYLNLSFYARDRIGIASLVMEIDSNTTNVTGLEWTNIVLSEGSHNITLRVVDRAGRRTSTDTVLVIVDLVLPSLTISEQTVAEGKASFRWSAGDGYGIKQFAISVDGGTWQPGVNEGTYTSEKLGAGPHTIRISALDHAGNQRVLVWAFNVTASGGIEIPEEEGSGFPWWIALSVLSAIIVIAVIIALIVLSRRPKETQVARGAGPRKLSIGAIPAAIAPELPPNRPEGLPGAKVEEAEDGSGYIRPKTKERPIKKPRQMELDQEDQVEESGPSSQPAPAPAPAPMQVHETAPYPAGGVPLFSEAPASIEDAPIYYTSPSSVPEVEMPAGSPPPSSPDGGVEEVAYDDDAGEEFEEMEEFDPVEE